MTSFLENWPLTINVEYLEDEAGINDICPSPIKHVFAHDLSLYKQYAVNKPRRTQKQQPKQIQWALLRNNSSYSLVTLCHDGSPFIL